MTGSSAPAPQTDRHRGRAQVVLLAAAIATVALVPMALAYLSLGVHPDVAASTEVSHTGEETVRALDRAVANASSVADGHRWSARPTAVERFDDAIASDVAAVEAGRLASSVVVTVARNETAATAWQTANCPSGQNRAFGPCRVVEGVVVQERAGETFVVAVGFDVTVTGPDGTTDLTVVVRV